MKRITRLPAVLALLAALVLWTGAAYGSTISSNGTGGGNWTDTGTWSGGAVPVTDVDAFDIVSGDTVTASGVAYDGDSTLNEVIEGTLNLDAGSDFSNLRRLDYDSTTPGGILNVGDSSISADQIRPSTGGGLTVNLNDGGFMSLATGVTGSGVVVNDYAGAVYAAGNSSGTINIDGGTIYSIAATNFAIDPSTWTSGTVVTNTVTMSSTIAIAYRNFLSTNPTDVLNVSNSPTAQTLTWGNVSGASNFAPTSGTIQMNVYSAADNNSDQMVFDYATGGVFTSGVTLLVASSGDLPGLPADYIGSTYDLFSGVTFANLDPTLAPVAWDIGGTDYNVTFLDDISTDGTVTVAALTPVPEPAAIGVLSAAWLLCLRRRRTR